MRARDAADTEKDSKSGRRQASRRRILPPLKASDVLCEQRLSGLLKHYRRAA